VHQLETIALPRRFSLPMQEIWLLQSRFSQRKRVGRLLAHPRFRAAYDFLVLRQAASDEHADEARFWRDVQASAGVAEGDDAEATAPGDAEGGDDSDGEPRRRRRRRRRNTGSTGAA
jgi:poly(A) polymerase